MRGIYLALGVYEANFYTYFSTPPWRSPRYGSIQIDDGIVTDRYRRVGTSL